MPDTAYGLASTKPLPAEGDRVYCHQPYPLRGTLHYGTNPLGFRVQWDDTDDGELVDRHELKYVATAVRLDDHRVSGTYSIWEWRPSAAH